MKKYGFLLAFVILLIPVVWLYFLKDVKHVSSGIAIIGERHYSAEKGDTVYHTVSDFSFIDQLGDTVTEKDFKNCIYVANFFFASCPDICPKTMGNMQLVYDKYKNSPDIKFISHTVDPENDSVPVLYKYGKAMYIEPKHWYLVTGSKEDLYWSAEYDYLVSAVSVPVKDAFIHSEKLVLIDKDKRIRGYYNGLDYNEMATLKDDIKALLLEYK